MAHVAVRVPDCDAAVAWYESVLGLTVLSPPYVMTGAAIEDDMAELLDAPVAVKAAIVGIDRTDQVIEVVEYPNQPPAARDAFDFARVGISHIGLICDDMDETRARLEAAGAEMLTSHIASIARLRTTWFRDPWGIVFILVEKKNTGRAYWDQY